MSFCGDREVFAKGEYKFTSKTKIEYRANQRAISEGKKIPPKSGGYVDVIQLLEKFE